MNKSIEPNSITVTNLVGHLNQDAWDQLPGSDKGDACGSPCTCDATAEHASLACAPLMALRPRARPIEIDRTAAREQIQRELRTVALWTLGAIAAAGAVLDSAIAALSRRSPSSDGRASTARIVVGGRMGSGRRTLSCALAARAG